MSNRENLRRIAALSLVIAFGMSGAAGLADATNEVTNIAEEGEGKKDEALTVSFNNNDFTPVMTSPVPNTYLYTGEKLKVVDNTAATYDLSAGWSFKRGESDIWFYDVKSSSENCKIENKGTFYTLEFNEAGRYSITIKAIENGVSCNDSFITLIFDVEAEQTPPAPVEKTATLVVDGHTGDFVKVDDDTTNVYEYKPTDDLAFDENGECKVEFKKFWNFVLGSGADSSDVDDTANAADGNVSLTFKKNDVNTFKVIVFAKDGDKTYNTEKDDALTLVFNVEDYVPEEPVKPEFKIEYNNFLNEFKLVEEAGTYDLWRYSEPKILTDESATISFYKFWKFTLSNETDELAFDISADDDGCKIVPTGEEYATAPDYKVTFSQPGTHTFTVSVKDDTEGYKAVKVQFIVENILTPILRPGSDFALTEDKSFQFKGDFVEVDEESGCKYTATFKPFWNYYLDDDTVDTAIFDSEGNKVDAVPDEDGNITLSFAPGATYNYTVKALKDVENSIAYETAEVVPLVFDVPEHKVDRKLEIIADKKSDDFSGFDGDELYSGRYKQTVLEESALPYTVTFDKFWQFTADSKPVVEVNNIAEEFGDGVEYSVGEDGKCTLTFKSFGRYNIKMYADGHTAKDDDCLSIFFDISPIPEFNTNGNEWENYFSKDADKSEFTYKKDLTLSNGTCEAAFPTFWHFAFKDGYVDSNSTGGYIRPDTGLEGAKVSFNESDKMHHILFSKACTYTFYVRAEGTFYDYDEPEVKLIFTVNPEPIRTDPPYIPVDPVTPAPTATPTATPAPTETPAPTDTPTDAPTSAPTAAPDVEMQVSAGGKRLNVRSGAGIGNSIIARLNDGSKVTVLLVEGDWSYIRATDNGNVIEGYVSSQYLKEISTVEPTEPTNARVSTSGSALRLRSRASLNAPIIARMPNGSSLKVLETVNGWCRVQFTAANGTVHEGWASSQYITVIA